MKDCILVINYYNKNRKIKKASELKDFIIKLVLKETLKSNNVNQVISSGKFLVAQYNSPYALPPFRKNEIIVPIK